MKQYLKSPNIPLKEYDFDPGNTDLQFFPNPEKTLLYFTLATSDIQDTDDFPVYVINLISHKVIDHFEISSYKIVWMQFMQNEPSFLAMGSNTTLNSSQLSQFKYTLHTTGVQHQILKSFLLPFQTQQFHYFSNYLLCQGQYKNRKCTFVRYQLPLNPTTITTENITQRINQSGCLQFTRGPQHSNFKVLGNINSSFLSKSTFSYKSFTKFNHEDVWRVSWCAGFQLLALLKHLPTSLKSKCIHLDQNVKVFHLLKKKIRVLVTVQNTRQVCQVNVFNLNSLKTISASVVAIKIPNSYKYYFQVILQSENPKLCLLEKNIYFRKGTHRHARNLFCLELLSVVNKNKIVGLFKDFNDKYHQKNIIIFAFQNKRLRPLKIFVFLNLPYRDNLTFATEHILFANHKFLFFLEDLDEHTTVHYKRILVMTRTIIMS